MVFGVCGAVQVEEGVGFASLVEVGFGSAVVAVAGSDFCHFQRVQQRVGVCTVVVLCQSVFDEDAFFVNFLHSGFSGGFALLYGSDFFAEVDFGFALGEACQFLFDEAFDLFAADAVLCGDGGDLVVADLVRGDGGIHSGVDGAVNVFGLLVKLGDLLYQFVHFVDGGVGFRRGIAF